MGLLEELATLGVNTEEGVARVMGNASLYERLMGKFNKTMASTPIAVEDFDCEDCTELIEKTHAIKGASGNLSLTPIYEAYSEIVRLLRQNEPAQAKEVFEGVQSIQKQIIDCIDRHSA